MSTWARQSIIIMSAKGITERYQQVINPTWNSSSTWPRIIGVEKQVNGICLQYETEEQANGLWNPNKVYWETGFEGVKLDEPNYEVVIHGMSITKVDSEEMKDN